MKIRKNKNLTSTVLFAVLILAFTLTGAVTPIGGGAYIHIGDAMIYLAALILPFPYAIAAAVVGAGIADLMLGSAVYFIPTLIIKTLTVIAVKAIIKRVSKPELQDLAVCLAGVVTVVGYYIAEVIILLLSGKALGAAFITGASNSIIYNIVQALASAAVYMILSGFVRKRIAVKKAKQAEQEKNEEL